MRIYTVYTSSIYEWKDFKNTNYYRKLANYNCHDNSLKFVNRPHYNNYVNDKSKIVSPKNYEERKVLIRIDTIEILDSKNGEPQNMINILDLIINDNHFYNLLISSRSARCKDLLHVNDVRVLDKQKFINKFSRHSNIKKLSDQNISENILMVSLRDINSIIFIDANNPKKILWHISGLFENQHSPRFLENGNILVFDNYAFDENGSKFGHTAIKEINLEKKEIVSIFNGGPDFNFQSQRRGRIQVVKDEIFVISGDQSVFFKLICTNELDIIR